jgi:hypothetical protein
VKQLNAITGRRHKAQKGRTLMHQTIFLNKKKSMRIITPPRPKTTITQYHHWQHMYFTSLAAGALGEVTPPPNLLAAKSLTDSLASAT